MDTKILLASYGGGHVNIITKLYYHFKSLGYSPYVLGFTSAELTLNKHSIPFLSYKDFLNSYEEKSEIEKMGKNLLTALGTKSLISEEESIAYLGINYFELKNKFGDEKAKAIYDESGRSAFYPYEFAKKVIKQLKPDIVISTNSPRSEAAILEAAKHEKIRTYCVNDFYAPDEIEERTGDSTYSDKLFVCTNGIRKIFINKGWKPENVICSGNPAFDDISSDEVINKSITLKDEYPILKQKKNVLFIMATGDIYKSIDKVILNRLVELKKDLDFNLIIRQHPNDTEIIENDDVMTSKKEDSLHAWLHCSDVIVTILSTVGLEASLLDIPVVQYLPKEAPLKLSFSELEIGTETNTLDELTKELDQALKGQSSLKVKRIQNASKIICDTIISDLNK